LKILFIHPTLRNYRIELFEKLHQKFDITYLFLQQKRGGIDLPSNWNYSIIDLDYGLDFFKNLKNWLSFTFKLFKEEYDIIIASPAESLDSIIALLITKLKKKKIIFWGESWYYPSNISLRYLRFKLVMFLLSLGDAVIGSGNISSEFYKKFIKKNIIFNAPNYVPPLQIIDTSPFLKKLYKKDKKIVKKKIVLYLGRIIERKGLDYLIKAFKLLEEKFDDVYLLIVGDGPFIQQCRKLTLELGVENIMFTCQVPDNEIPIYYNLCDIFVLPAILIKDHPEAIGLVVCEAMSVGKPIVVTNSVGALQYVQDGENGYVVQDKNDKELYEALSKILIDEELMKKMGRKSKEIYDEKINLEKQYNTFVNVIEQIIKR